MKKIIVVLGLFFALQVVSQKSVVDVVIFKKMTTTERNLLSPILTETWFIYNTTDDQFQFYNGTDWVGLPQLAGGNNFSGDQTFSGNVNVIGEIHVNAGNNEGFLLNGNNGFLRHLGTGAKIRTNGLDALIIDNSQNTFLQGSGSTIFDFLVGRDLNVSGNILAGDLTLSGTASFDNDIKIAGKLSLNTEADHPFGSTIYFPKTEDIDGSVINTFIDLTRDSSDSATNFYYGLLRRVVYSGSDDLKEQIGAYDIARYTGSGDIESLISKLNVTSYRGQGNVTNAIFGQQNRALVDNLTGNANINVAIGQENKVTINDDKATIEWVQGSSSSIEILAAADVKNAFVHRFNIDEINVPLDNLYILYQNETVIPPIKEEGEIYFLYSLMDVPSLLSGELTAKSFISDTINENDDLKAKSIVYNETNKRFEAAKNTNWQTLTIEDKEGNVNATGSLRYKIINNRLIINGTLTPTSLSNNEKVTEIGFLPAGFIPDATRRIPLTSSSNSFLEVTAEGLISIGNSEVNLLENIDFEFTLNIND